MMAQRPSTSTRLPTLSSGSRLGMTLEETSARERVESLMAELPAAEAFAALEHELGVLPLLDAFFENGEPGRKRGSLGLFTPRPEPGLEAGAVDGKPA